MPCPKQFRQITKVTVHPRGPEGSRLLVQTSGADLGEDVLLDGLVVLVDDVHQANAIAAAVGEDIGDIEIPEGGDQLPLAVVELPDLVLIETCQNSGS